MANPTTVPQHSTNKSVLPSLIVSHEPMKEVVKEELDTTTPMVKPGGVSRFVTADVQKYAPWLLPKLTERWPAISAMTFSGWIMGWTGGNTFYFVKTDNAVGLFEVYRQTPELSNKAREVFVFLESFKNAAHQEQGIAIYKHAKQWARSIGVKTVHDIGSATDLPLVRLRDNAGAKTDNGLCFEL